MSNELVAQKAELKAFNFFDQEQFATMQRLCLMFANSELVPEMYRITPTNPKEKAIANNMIALEMAQRIGASPLMVMQNLYIVYGRPGWSSKFLTATVNTCGRYETVKYRLMNKGKVKFNNIDIDNWECIAYTREKGNDEILESTPVDIKMAIDEGWYGKKGSKWVTMPLKMLKYRSVSFWTNEYAPELSMGMHTADELDDIETIPYEDVSDKVRSEVKEKANSVDIKMPEDDPQPSPQSGAADAGKEANTTTDGKEGNQQGEIKGPGF